jgi:5-methylcytosine-specific restriction enzyme subunit McrC
LADNLRGYDVKEEYALTEMMRYLPGLNPRHRRSPTPRPDFVVKKGDTVVRLLDAKYRDLWERELPRDMLYQLAMYALSQPQPSTATILFPTMNVDATAAVVEIRDPVRPAALGYVELRPVVLGAVVDVLRRPQVERERFAWSLAFGRSTSAN